MTMSENAECRRALIPAHANFGESAERIVLADRIDNVFAATARKHGTPEKDIFMNGAIK